MSKYPATNKSITTFWENFEQKYSNLDEFSTTALISSFSKILAYCKDTNNIEKDLERYIEESIVQLFKLCLTLDISICFFLEIYLEIDEQSDAIKLVNDYTIEVNEKYKGDLIFNKLLKDMSLLVEGIENVESGVLKKSSLVPKISNLLFDLLVIKFRTEKSLNDNILFIKLNNR